VVVARVVTSGLAVALAGWAAVGLARPAPIAARLGIGVGEVRVLALRDLGSVVPLIVSRDPRPALAMRMLFDLSDAALYGGRREVLPLAIAGATVDALGIVAASR
jgi:hypothetical protein